MVSEPSFEDSKVDRRKEGRKRRKEGRKDGRERRKETKEGHKGRREGIYPHSAVLDADEIGMPRTASSTFLKEGRKMRGGRKEDEGRKDERMADEGRKEGRKG